MNWEKTREASYVLLSLTALVTFAASQSLYELLARNPKFVALRITSNWELLEIVFVFNLLPVLILFLVWGWIRWRLPRLAPAFLASTYTILFLLFFLRIHNSEQLVHWQEIQNSYYAWIIPAGALGLASIRYPQHFRALVLPLAAGVLIFPSLFLWRTWSDAGDQVRQTTEPGGALGVTANLKDLPPIFLVVFDELALHALLDGDGSIDAQRFPNFHRLRQNSYWFRNTTANADYTYQSIPSILTGQFPVAGRVPSARDYPRNILNLLHRNYDVYAYEWWEQFCVKGRFHCVEDKNQIVARQSDLIGDIFRLYILNTVPKGADFALPFFMRMWAQFKDAKTLTKIHLERFEKFMQVLSSLENDREKNVLFFFHHALPHAPYLLSPEGNILEVEAGYFDPKQKGNKDLLREMFELYRMQIMCVDSQLGQFLTKLEEMGLYDKSLLIVTADHGVSYKPEAPGRPLQEVDGVVANADLILTVPLFIKLPFQTNGTVSDRDVQLVDLVPTVTDLLHLGVPWELAGRSVFGPPGESRMKVAYDQQWRRYEFANDLGLSITKLSPAMFDSVPEPSLQAQSD